MGIFIATALSLKGLKVGIVERNLLKGVFVVLIIDSASKNAQLLGNLSPLCSILIPSLRQSERTRMEYLKEGTFRICPRWHFRRR